MQLSNLPQRIIQAFANASALKNTIPQTTATPGAASFNQGFPALTMTPLASGGVPPSGQDFNGIFYALSLVQQWQSAGGFFSYDATWSAANNGYPKGAMLLRAGGDGFWINTTDNNTADPDGATQPSGWVPGPTIGITSVTGLTNANVTLSNVQAGRPVITLAGTLTGNIQIIVPTWAGAQWVFVNNTTGNFTVTVKTAAGTGVPVTQDGAPAPLLCDGTNVINATPAGRLIGRRVISTVGASTYTPTPGTRFVDVIVVGGGGSGGGTQATGAGQSATGGGGGGGGWAIKRITSGFSGVTATVGAGGTSAVGVVGNAGGTSSFGALVSATGGGGGQVGPALSSTPTFASGFGTPGAGSNGDVNFNGGIGWYGLIMPNPTSGKGGSSYGGEGGMWATGYQSGGNAQFYGAGGGGGSADASKGVTTSGAGFQGVIIVHEYA